MVCAMSLWQLSIRLTVCLLHSWTVFRRIQSYDFLPPLLAYHSCFLSSNIVTKFRRSRPGIKISVRYEKKKQKISRFLTGEQNARGHGHSRELIQVRLTQVRPPWGGMPTSRYRRVIHLRAKWSIGGVTR